MTQKMKHEFISEPIPELASQWAFWAFPKARYMVYWYEFSHRMDRNLFTKIVYYLLNHHEMLRLHVFKQDYNILPYISDTLGKDAVLWINLSNIHESEHSIVIREKIEETYKSLDVYEGQLSRFIYFDRGDGNTGFFLTIFHHGLFDLYSLFILSQDVQKLYWQFIQGKAANLPPKTAPFVRFVQRITQYRREEYPKERSYWLDCSSKFKLLPVDYPENRIISFNGTVLVPPMPATVIVTLSNEETSDLFQYIPIMKIQVLHSILASIVQAFVQWSGESLSILLIDSGRTLFNNLDLSRSIGNFTIGLRMLLELGKNISPIDALWSIIQQVNNLPFRGAGPGFGDFATDTLPEVDTFASYPYNVLINYVGGFRTTTPFPSTGEGQSFFHPTQQYSDLTMPSQFSLGHNLLSISCFENESKLTFYWSYDKQLYHPSTIEWLAQNSLNYLKAIINYCVAKGRK